MFQGPSLMRNKTFASELSRERCTLDGSLEMKQGSGKWLYIA